MWEVYKQNIAVIAIVLSIYIVGLVISIPWLAYLTFYKKYWKASVFMVLAIVQVVFAALYAKMLIGW